METKRNTYSVLILSFNEEANIGRTIGAIPPDREVVVIDSGSTDQTHAIVGTFPNATLHVRPFDNLMNQWNFGHTKVTHPWVLSLDADYLVSPALLQEIERCDQQKDSYEVGFQYCIYGKPIRSAVLPNRIVFYNRLKSMYSQDGHAQKILIQGNTGKLTSPLYHDDRKPLARWFVSQNIYSEQEIQKLLFETKQYSWADKIRMKTIFAPFLVFFYCYIVKGGILEGKYGLLYAVQRLYAETIFLVKRLDYSLGNAKHK